MKSSEFISALKESGVTAFTGVPCSVFKEVIAYLEQNERYLIASSEGEAMGIAAGISLNGGLPAVIMQNDGFGNTINPLTSLTKIYEFPTLLIISWRGEPGKKDAPQHKWSGKTLLQLLDVFDIKYSILSDDLDAEKENIDKLMASITSDNRIGALICPKGIFEKEKTAKPDNDFPLSRQKAIEIVSRHIDESTKIFSATGKPSRELYKVNDRPQNFYVVGSMGCTSSIGFGYRNDSDKKTVIIDGDGGVLMKMGTLATIGYYQPDNYLHICLDNESYESTGGQATVSSAINLSEVASACKYKKVKMAKTEAEIESFMKEWNENPELAFLHIKVRNETDPDLGRPSGDPVDWKKRFMDAP